MSSRYDRQQQYRENARLEKLGWSMMTKAERAASDQRVYDRNAAAMNEHKAKIVGLLSMPVTALAAAFDKTAQVTKAQLDKWALGFAERPAYQLSWAGNELFEIAALNEIAVHYAAACRAEGFTLENFIDYVTREATMAAIRCPNSTSPTQVLHEQAKGRVVCQMAFRDGFSSSAVTVPGFYLTPVDFAKLAIEYRDGDQATKDAIVAKH